MTEFDPYREAADAVTREAENWMPHREGDQPATIVGLYVRSEEAPDQGYGTSEIKTVRERDGREWSVRLYGKVLASEWAAADPQIGEVVAIRYLGELSTKDGTMFRGYRVAVAREPRPAEPERATRGQEAAFERAQMRIDEPEPVGASRFGDDAPF
jgi:hypothetical protein